MGRSTEYYVVDRNRKLWKNLEDIESGDILRLRIFLKICATSTIGDIMSHMRQLYGAART